MKHLTRYALIFLVYLFIIYVIFSLFCFDIIVYALEDDIPIFDVQDKGDYVEIKTSNELLKENILYSTEFELKDERPTLLNNLSYGNQSFAKLEWLLTGNHLIKIEQTTPNKGNLDYKKDTSVAKFRDMKYVDNDNEKYITMSIEVKNNKESTIKPYTYGGAADKQISIEEAFNSSVPFKFAKRTYLATSYFYVTNPEELNNYLNQVDGLYIALEKSDNGDYDYARIESVNIKTGKVDIDKSWDEVFRENEDVLIHRYVNPLNFEEKTFFTNNQWQTINFTSKINTFDIYDISKRGFNYDLLTKSEGTTYINNIHIGYATKYEIFRNNKSIYIGYDETFVDNLIEDTASPNAITNLEMNKTNNNNIEISWDDSIDNGTIYNYNIRSFDKDGNPLKMSKTKQIKKISNNIRYKYIISENKKDEAKLEINNNKLILNANTYNETDYLKIIALDEFDNESSTYSVQLKNLLTDSNTEVENLLIEDKNKTIQLNIPTIDTFGTLKFRSYKYQTKINFKNNFVINNETNKEWYLTLNVEQFKVKEKENFIGDPYKLPEGSLTLGNLTNLKSSRDSLPEILYTNEQIIDNNQSILILKSTEQSKKGIFSFNFDYLSLIIDPVTMKVDNLNYQNAPTPYETVLKWNIVVGP